MTGPAARGISSPRRRGVRAHPKGLAYVPVPMIVDPLIEEFDRE